MRNLSIRVKLFVLFFISMLVAAALAIVGMYVGNESIFDETLQGNVNASMLAVFDRTDSMKDLSKRMAEIIAEDEAVHQAVVNGDKQEVLSAVNFLFEKYDIGVEYATISNAEGIVIARTYSDKSGDSVAGQKNIKAAMNGNAASYIESGTEIQLAIRSGRPINDADGKIIGIVSAGYRLDTDKFVDGLKQVSGTDITVFKGDTRVATTIMSNGVRQTGTKLDSSVADHVINNKQIYYARTIIFGEPYYTKYEPVISDGEVLGIFFTGMPLKDINANKLRTTIMTVALVLVLCGIMLAITSVLYRKQIVDPLIKMTKAALQLSEGRLDIEGMMYQSRDEIGRLSQSMYSMSLNFKKLINDLNNMSEQHHLGDLDFFVDKEGYQGSYQEVAVAVNRMVAEHIDVEKKAMTCVTEMVNGDFSAAMMQLPGKKAFINKAVEDLRASLRDINAEVDSMIKNAIAGNLSARIDVSKYNGDWVKLMSGLNEVLKATANPIHEALSVVNKMAEGNFSLSMTGSYNGDFAQMKHAVNTTVANISDYIKEISYNLNELANNNLNLTIKREYVGEFADIKTSLNNIIEKLNHVMDEIKTASAQVAEGSRQISESSETLAQGAAEQASAVEELTSMLTSVSDKTRMNAQNAKKAKELSAQSTENANKGSSEMRQMLIAMENIKESSNNISRIIKVIDDIAFQTNLLALNAAVEAARAGEHGRGFVVVAEEVRSLAAKSQNAARDTTAMIEASIAKVNDGTGIAQATAGALSRIVSNISEVSSIVSDISGASDEQNLAIAQINEGVSQIADVVQTNSATSEESASSAQELSSQSEMLKNMIQVFKLRG